MSPSLRLNNISKVKFLMPMFTSKTVLNVALEDYSF